MTIYFSNPDGSTHEYLSQWYPCSFTCTECPGVIFRTTEMYMMYQKALLFDDRVTASKILEAPTPNEQQALGRQVGNFDSKIWNANKERVVREGNQLNFNQAQDRSGHSLRTLLLATGDRELVEASPEDRVWGIGAEAAAADATPRDQWGLNLLGEAITEVRSRLRAETD